MSALLERPVSAPTTPEPELTPEQLTQLRELARWSRARFGEVLGYSRSAIELMEAGQRRIPLQLQRTARALVEQQLRREIAQRQAALKAIAEL